MRNMLYIYIIWKKKQKIRCTQGPEKIHSFVHSTINIYRLNQSANIIVILYASTGKPSENVCLFQEVYNSMQ